MNPFLKIAITALLIYAVSEIAGKHNKLAALIASLPLVTTLAMLWMFVEKRSSEAIANHAYYTFWYVVPTMPMFLLMPWMMRKGVSFPISLIAGLLTTFVLFFVTVFALRKFGIDLDPRL